VQHLAGGAFLPYLALCAVVAGNAAANLLLKVGAIQDRPWLFGILGWRSIMGIALFGAAMLVYAWALRHVPLSRAQFVVVLQYPGVILLAAMVLGERVGPMQWLGIALVMAGMFIALR